MNNSNIALTILTQGFLLTGTAAVVWYAIGVARAGRKRA